MSKGFRVLGLVALVALLAYSFVRYDRFRGFRPSVLRPGSVVQPFTLTEASTGKSVNLSDFADRPVLLTFWGASCPSCRHELPGLQALADRYKDRVAVLTITADGGPEALAVARAQNLTLPILLDGGEVSDRFEVYTIPYNVVLSRGLTVVTDQVGPAEPAQLESWVRKAL
jgi:thiol-disulfide isomerase/thioredoxin